MTDEQRTPCNPHPNAPHGFNRNASHSEGRYVCDCEGWEPPVHIDIERMERALAGPRWTIPPGLSHEELNSFITDCAAGKIPPDKP